MIQLHDRVVFKPISANKMKKLEIKRAMENLILLNKKRDKTIKSIISANGSTQQAYILREEATISTVPLEAIITTGVIEDKHKRNVMTLDIPNSFLQTKIALDGDNVIMKIKEKLVDIFLEFFSKVYNKYV